MTVDYPADLGARLRVMRRQGRYSLAEVAEATGISTSFLSVVENGDSDITVGRLLRLVRFYGISLTDLLSDPVADPAVSRRGEGTPIFSSVADVSNKLIAPSTAGEMLCFVTELPEPETRITYDPHPGEEFIFVLSGKLVLELGTEDPVSLKKGESVYFRAERSHTLAGKASVLVVVSPAGLWVHEAEAPEQPDNGLE